MTRMNKKRVLIGLALLGAMLSPVEARAQALSSYTAYPETMPQSVPPNILFLVDMGEQTLRAAHAGSNHQYILSYKASTVTANLYSANVTLSNLVAIDATGAAISSTTANKTTPADTFDSSKTYYGLFDSLRCYQYAASPANTFVYESVKASVSATCDGNDGEWDGNFLNWLAVRSKDAVFQAFIGGTTSNSSADTNSDATLDAIQGQWDTGETGDNRICVFSTTACWRYVKFVPTATMAGRVPSTLPSQTSGGRFFGSGEGLIWVNTDTSPDPFDHDKDTDTGSASHIRYAIKVDLNTEPDSPSGNGLLTGNCIVGDSNFAGHRICYRRDQSLGLYQQLRTDGMHLGVEMTRSEAQRGGQVIVQFDEVATDTKFINAVKNIRNERVKDGSPISEALYEGLCYYRNSQGQCYSNKGAGASVGYTASVGAASDPYYFDTLGQSLACCKSNILLISPGVGEADGNTPELQTPFGDLFAGADIGVSGNNAAGTRLDDVAFYGQTNDLRNQSGAGGLAGTQNVTFWTLNAMGSSAGTALLASASTYGGFNDLDSDGQVDLTGQSCTYPAGSSLGSGSGTSSAEWDVNQDCVPDTYFEGGADGDLARALQQAVAAILDRAGSGSAVSVLATAAGGEGAVYQSFYFPAQFEGLNEIKWTGYTRGLFLDSFGNLREDSNADGKLVYTDDKIIQTRLDTTQNQVLVDRFNDADGNGLKDGTTPTDTVELKEIKGIWQAGERLALTASSNRKIKTWIDQDNDGVVDGGEQIDFTTTNASDLKPYLRADASGTYTAANIINFIRGDQVAGMRNRQLMVGGSLKVWKFGDPVHSRPTVVGAPQQRYDVLYGDTTYTPFFAKYMARRQVVYVGANDGMLHAFNSGYYHRGDDSVTGNTEHGYFTRTPTDNSSGKLLGDELFGFIPQELLPHLKWLTQTDYTHVYYVDLKPKVTDARIFTADTDHPNGWGTILIGGLRLGGSCGACTSSNGAPPMTVTDDFNGDGDTMDADDTRSFFSAYFVLDITNPESADYPKLLWSFSSSDLGLTTAVPSMLRVSPQADGMTDNTNAKWYLVMSSGATGYEGSIAQGGKLYAIDLAQGPGANNGDVVTMTAETLNAFMSDTLTVDADFDYRVDAAYMGGVIHDGTLPWRGKLYRLTMNDCTTTPCSTGTWGIDGGSGTRVPTEVLAEVQTNTDLGPVVAQPAVAIDDSSKLWLFAGTGRYYSAADRTSTEQQYVVGVKDSVLNGGCTESSTTSCHTDDLVNVSNAQVCVLGTGNCGGSTDQVTGVTGATNFPSLISLVASKDGWYTTLPASGERALFRPVAVGGLVIFPTFVPSGNACASTGSSRLYALYYLTGSAYSSPVIGGGSDSSPLSGVTTSGGTDYVNRSVTLGDGIASEIGLHKGKGTGAGRAGGIMQDSLGQNIRVDIDTAAALASRVRSWRLH